MQNHRLVPAALAAVLLALSACGGSGTPGIDAFQPPDDVADPGPLDPGAADDDGGPRDDVPPVDVPVDSPADVPVDVPPADVPADVPVDAPADVPPADLPPDVPPADVPPDAPADVPPADVPVDTGSDEGGDLGPCPQGWACDDGDPCTFNETCQGGMCQGGTRYVCDDLRGCTTDTCDGAGHCRYALLAGNCLVRGACRAAGEVDPGNPCRACDPAATVGDWTPTAEGADCDPAAALAACEVAEAGQCRDGACLPVGVEPRPCDDGNPCTADGCAAPAGCTHAVLDGTGCTTVDACHAGRCDQGVCVVPPGDGDCNDGNDCTADLCDPAVGCSNEVLDGPVCADGNACTQNDVCAEGLCGGLTVNCEDGNICTLDGCDPVTGCYHDLADNACCQGGVSICNDRNPCTDDGCDPGTLACRNTDNTAACDDHDPCTVGDACGGGTCQPGTGTQSCNDGNDCTDDSCTPGIGCVNTPNDSGCDDRNTCTLGDHCQAGTCVPGAGALSCTDDNPCTDDWCFPSTGCAFLPNIAPCDDGDPCTLSDRCRDTACAGRAVVCDDRNECTSDACDGGPCVFTPLDAIPCEDGLACTTTDHCEAGTCVVDLAECDCHPAFSPDVTKLTSLQVPATGLPGDGLDLDGNPATCAPSTDCAGGIDNTLGPLASLGNDALAGTLADGSLILLLEHAPLKTDGSFYTLSVLIGDGLDPSDPGCDVQAQSCPYLVSGSSLDLDTCKARVFFANARISGGRLTAGGRGATFPFEVDVAGIPLRLDLFMAQIDAAVTLVDGHVTALDGFLGGAVPKQQIQAAIEALPPDVELPMPREQLIALLDLLVVPDMDIDGDGVFESASLSLRVQGIPGTITGVAP